MAPGSPFPELPMDQIQANEIKKVYHLMYKHIAEEFVHWDDLKITLQNGNLQITTQVNTVLAGSCAPGGPDFLIKGTGLGVGTQRTTNFIYQKNASGLARIAQHNAAAIGLGKAQDVIVETVETGVGVA